MFGFLYGLKKGKTTSQRDAGKKAMHAANKSVIGFN
jgi:hypothetical protein